jgi:hypothetical protein
VAGGSPPLNGKILLRRASQHNPPLAISHLQNDWVVELDRMFFAVDADDEVRWWHLTFNFRRRGCFTWFRYIAGARQEIRGNDAPSRGKTS